MLQNSVQESCGQDRITHHLCPVRNLLVGRKDQGRCLVGITDKGKEPIGLGPGDRSVPDFVLWEVFCYGKLTSSINKQQHLS